MSDTEIVNTHELKEGDLVRYYGVTFRLKDRINHGLTAGFDPITQGDCISFATDVIHDDGSGIIPRHWRDSWTIQGNRRAHWSRITATPQS